MEPGADVPDEPVVVAPCEHTMGDSLHRYVETRVHELVDDPQLSAIRVIGSHDRSLEISAKEKRDKLENWQRPTAVRHNDFLEVHCFPGRAYVFHYASLIATWLALNERDPGVVKLELPGPEEGEKEIHRMGLSELRPTSTVVLASGISALFPSARDSWVPHPRFQATSGTELGPDVTCLAVEHSFWGDIAYHLGRALAKEGFLRIVFVGKLGSLNPGHVPNRTIVTGSSSELAGEAIRWVNLFEDCELVNGRHVTLPSVLQETNTWFSSVSGQFEFVDPEIGNFAAGVAAGGGSFSYLHIVSDNLAKSYRHDLSNEREKDAPIQRADAYARTHTVLKKHLMGGDRI